MGHLHIVSVWWVLGESLNRTVLTGVRYILNFRLTSVSFREEVYREQVQKLGGSERPQISSRQVVAGNREVERAGKVQLTKSPTE